MPAEPPGSGRFAGEKIGYPTGVFLGFLGGLAGKESACMWETWVSSLGWEDPLERGKATHSSILAWVAKSWT